MDLLLTDLQQRIHRRLQADDTALRQECVELGQLVGSVIRDMSLRRIDVQDGAGSDERVGGVSVEERYLLIGQTCGGKRLRLFDPTREGARTYRRRGNRSLWLA